MKIKREVGGTEYEFELSTEELMKAWNEYEDHLRTEDFLYIISGMEDEEVKEEYGVTTEEFKSLIPEMVEWYWHNRDHGYQHSDALDRSIEIVTEK